MQALPNLAPTAQARLGTTLSGKWRLDRVLGVGGVATVYLVTHRNQSRAALKLLHPAQAQNTVVRERFVLEGYTANSIDHPGVVRVIDDDVSEDGLPYLVMELLEGETLDDRAYRHGDRLPEGDVLALTDQLLDVLAAAHEKRVIHRDIKPENLFLTFEGRLKVLDFGIARLTQDVPQREVTAVGTLMGTPSFMSPEQARSRWEEVDATSDVFSAGATMFNLLTGRFVREAETLTEQLALAIHEPATKLASADPNLSAGVCSLVDKALAYDKRDRFPDARSMQVEVRRLRELLPAVTSSVSPEAVSAGRKSSSASPDARTLLESGRVPRDPVIVSKPITIAVERRVAVVAALALLGLVVWLLLRSRGASTAEPERARTAGASSAVTPLPPAAAPDQIRPPEAASTASAPTAPAPETGVVPSAGVVPGVTQLGRLPAKPRPLKAAVTGSAAPSVPSAPPLPRPAAEDPFFKRY